MGSGEEGKPAHPSLSRVADKLWGAKLTYVHVSEERNSSSVIRSENSSSSSSSSSRSSEFTARVGWQKADTRQAQGRQAGRRVEGTQAWRGRRRRKGRSQALVYKIMEVTGIKNHIDNRHVSNTVIKLDKIKEITEKANISYSKRQNEIKILE